MKKIFILWMILPLAFTSCKSGKHAKEVATIDSLYTVIDSVERSLQSIDTAGVKKAVKEYSENIGKIKENFADEDRKDEDLWKTITTYGVVKKPLKTFVKEYPGFYREIRFSRKQLDSLKYDIRNGNIADTNIIKYTKDEANAVNDLRMQVMSSVKITAANFKLCDSLEPSVRKVIEKLEKKGRKKTESKTEIEEEDD
jgi:DNA polymerase I-like protein with 3'-5' exonuclease and polymerase domains